MFPWLFRGRAALPWETLRRGDAAAGLWSEPARAPRYFVAEKSDGERRLLVTVDADGRPASCLVDRRGAVDVVTLAKAPPIGSVVDGEVVRNLATGAPVFLAFDVLHDGRNDLCQKHFGERFFGSLCPGGPLAACLAAPCPPREGDVASALSPREEDAAFFAAAPAAAPGAPPTVRVVPKRFVPPKMVGARVLARISRDDDCGGGVPFGARVYRDGAARAHLSDGLVFVPDTPYARPCLK